MFKGGFYVHPSLCSQNANNASVSISQASALADFDRDKLISQEAAWAEIEFVNREMGPTRFCGSPEHRRFVNWIKIELARALTPAQGEVFEDVFENFPLWSPKSWSLEVNGKAVPVASYVPYCTGGFTGRRAPLTAAATLASPGGGGHYPRANGRTVVAFKPSARAEGQLVDLGVQTNRDTIDWARAAGKIALVRLALSSEFTSSYLGSYTVNGVWEGSKRDAGRFAQQLTSSSASAYLRRHILADAANRAGVLGVVLAWQGVSDDNAEGQWEPCPFSSSPHSSSAGSDPAKTKPGIPALFVNETVGRQLASDAASGASATITIEAEFEQVSTAAVWGLLPGARFGHADDEILICNTHSDGPNMAEENAGIAVVNMARYFAQVPLSKREKTMVFLSVPAHFSNGFLGKGSRDWITQHPQIVAKTVGVLCLEHLGCREWRDVRDPGGSLRYMDTSRPLQSAILITAPEFDGQSPAPPDPVLERIVESALARCKERAAILSGGEFWGEGAGFIELGIPTIGFCPWPEYFKAWGPDGLISKLDPAVFHDQLQFSVHCLLAMQVEAAAARKDAG
ncbi:hypothetical protein PMN64_34135 [Bradyrhizobium sp. UFLA01-814]|uniref:hypothetical protein n=1 Tax=Bradyrhizobium sp. UFLA01-814 TaxID=3023480 RepID=UPI00398A9169